MCSIKGDFLVSKSFKLMPHDLDIDVLSSKLLNRLLLSGDEPETSVSKIHEDLRNLAQEMRDFKIPVQKYTIFTVSPLRPSTRNDAATPQTSY